MSDYSSEPLAVDTVGVLGVGLRGSGIAESVARAGLDVIAHEPVQAVLELARQRIEKSLGRGVGGGKISDEEAAAALDRITFSTVLEDMGKAQVVIEAITEDVAVKRDAFRILDE